MGMGSKPTTMMPQYGGFPQGGSGQQFGTYDPILGFGQASGMGTTYNAPTRYTADYTRFLQSGQPFNPAVMGYNSYGQIFAQPQRPPPPTMGKGGGSRRPPAPTLGSKGGQQVGSPGVPSTGFDPEGYFRNRPVRGPRGDQGSRGEYGNFLDFYTRQNNPANSIFETGPVGQIAVGPQRPMDVEYPLDQNITNSPFAGLIGNGLGGMFAGRSQDPNLRVMGERNFRDFNLPPTADQFIDQPLAQPAVQPIGFNPIAQLTPEQVRLQQQQYDLANPERARLNAQLEKDMEAARAARPNAGRRLNFQEGGQVPPDAVSNMDMMLSEVGPANPQSEMAGEYDRLIQMTMQAVLGQTENADEIIQMFIDEFGADAFRQLRDAVLKQQVPGAQTEGMIDGNGGGMDDQVMGMIGNQRPVAVSPGEYIVPADVVSGLGDGSSKSGADILDELNQAVRMARTGTTEQPRPLAESMR